VGASWATRLKLLGVAAAVLVIVGFALAAALLRMADSPGGSKAPPASPVIDAIPLTRPRQAWIAPSLVIPVARVRREALVDTFTQAREGGARIHDAIDIMARQGTPVIAAAPGTVEKLFFSNNGGNTIYVRSPDRRTMYYYAHLVSYAPGLAERQGVVVGQVLGAVGATGNADPGAPHLHFAINVMNPADGWWLGQPVNPYPLLRGH
jgi:murein DD-endopeptidase MepM/ murein hydrolase activator NlpD